MLLEVRTLGQRWLSQPTTWLCQTIRMNHHGLISPRHRTLLSVDLGRLSVWHMYGIEKFLNGRRCWCSVKLASWHWKTKDPCTSPNQFQITIKTNQYSSSGSSEKTSNWRYPWNSPETAKSQQMPSLQYQIITRTTVASRTITEAERTHAFHQKGTHIQ